MKSRQKQLSRTRSRNSKSRARTLQTIYLAPSSRLDKKYMVKVSSRWIHFGQKGASDFTINHDVSRKANYLHRHQAKENWSHSGINTAGFGLVGYYGISRLKQKRCVT